MLCIFAHLLLPDKKAIVAAYTIAVYGNFLDLLSTIQEAESRERKKSYSLEHLCIHLCKQVELKPWSLSVQCEQWLKIMGGRRGARLS